MKLSKYAQAVYNAEICPYCKSKTKVVTETEIYGREYKGHKMIACANFPECDSYVGTHKDGRPLGRLANKQLREMRTAAHEKFDALWKSGEVTRDQAYIWLANKLEIPDEYCHFGWFKLTTAIKVYWWLKTTEREILLKK